MSTEPSEHCQNVYTGRVLWLLQGYLKFGAEFVGICKTEWQHQGMATSYILLNDPLLLLNVLCPASTLPSKTYHISCELPCPIETTVGEERERTPSVQPSTDLSLVQDTEKSPFRKKPTHLHDSKPANHLFYKLHTPNLSFCYVQFWYSIIYS